MNIGEYKELYPGETIGRERTFAHVQGMLKFDESADQWGGPYTGGYAFYYIMRHKHHLQTMNELKLKHRFSRHNFPVGRYGNPADSEEHLQKRLSTLSKKERVRWDQLVENFEICYPTVEKPVALFISGNDDVSYSKFFATIAEAERELEMLIDNQPLNIFLHVRENGFVFTN